MLNIFNIERQANKRVRSFLIHKATEENIESANARFVINIIIGKASIHLYDKSKYVKTINFRSVAEFFGKEYDENSVTAVHDYLVKLSKEQRVELSKLNVVICQTKGELGAHLYDEAKYKKRISTLELLTHFNTDKK